MNGLIFYRISHRLHRMGFPILPHICDICCYAVTNSFIPHTADIGAESKLAYFGVGVVIHKNAKIGKRVVIGQNVTIGRQLSPESVPEIGDNVYISAGARILGKIRIGSNVIVGANAVVIDDVPSNSIVAGIPARVIRSVNQNIYSLLENVYPVELDDLASESELT